MKYIWVSDGPSPSYHLSWLIELHVNIEEKNTGKRPVNHWKIFIDAHSGEILQKFDLARDIACEGHVTGDVKDVPYGEETNRGLPNVEVSVDGYGSVYTDQDGYYSIEVGESDVFATVRLEGNFLKFKDLRTFNSFPSTSIFKKSILLFLNLDPFKIEFKVFDSTIFS